MPRILHPQWREENEASPYPFADAAKLYNSASRFIPGSTFLDAALYPVGAVPPLRLSAVTVNHDAVTLYVGDSSDNEICSATFDPIAPPDLLRLADRYGRTAGVLVSDATRLGAFPAWGVGRHEFSVEETEFAADVCTPLPDAGFRGFVLSDGSVFSGDVWLTGENGIVLSVSDQPILPGVACQGVTPGPPTPSNQQVIRVDVVGDPLFRRKLCDNVFETPTLLRTITVKRGCKEIACSGDSFGNLQILAGSLDAEHPVLRIRTTATGGEISSTVPRGTSS